MKIIRILTIHLAYINIVSTSLISELAIKFVVISNSIYVIDVHECLGRLGDVWDAIDVGE